MHLILQVQVLPPTTFVLLLLRISIFYWKYLYIRFLIFLCYFFCIHGQWASSSHYVSVLLNIRQLNKLDLCQILTLFLRFSCKISFPRMLCCEASIIKCGLITDHQSFCHILSQNSEPEISLLLLSASS